MPSTEELMNSVLLGYDYSSLLATLSSKYCLWDIFEGYFNNQPAYTGLFDLVSAMTPVSPIEKARINLSTLSIPKGAAKAAEEVTTPTTYENSPTLVNQQDSTFNQYMKEMAAQLPLPHSTSYSGF